MIARPHSNNSSYGVLARGTGVFTTTAKSSGIAFSPIDVSTNEMTGDSIDFSMSKGNSLYSGSTLQPNALQVLACIRI